MQGSQAKTRVVFQAKVQAKNVSMNCHPDLGIGVLDGDGVGGEDDGAGEVHHGSPVVGGVVSGNAETALQQTYKTIG